MSNALFLNSIQSQLRPGSENTFLNMENARPPKKDFKSWCFVESNSYYVDITSTYFQASEDYYELECSRKAIPHIWSKKYII